MRLQILNLLGDVQVVHWVEHWFALTFGYHLFLKFLGHKWVQLSELLLIGLDFHLILNSLHEVF